MKKKLLKISVMSLVSGFAVPVFADSEPNLMEFSPETTIQEEVTSYDSAFADEDMQPGTEEETANRARIKAICGEINATYEQKTAIMGAVLTFKEMAIPLQAAVKVAKLKYVANVLAVSGTLKVANAVGSEAIGASNGILQAR
jgi:hypothetical protein